MTRIAHWPLDENSGSTAYDVAGSNDGSVTGAGPAGTGVVEGISGTSAYDFDGSDDDIGTGQFIQGKDVITGCCWANIPASTTGTNMVMGEYDGSDTWVRIGTTDQNTTNESLLLATRGGDSNSDHQYHSGDANLFDGNWHHFAWVVYNDQSISPEFYIDGATSQVVQTTDETNSYTGFFGTSDWYIGSLRTFAYYTGSLCDVRVYDRNITSQEIQALYSQPYRGRSVRKTKIS